MELWWCCGGALQRLDAAAMAGTSFTLAEKMNSRWIRSCRDSGSSREYLDLFWFMVVLITRRMVEWSLRDGGSGTHGGCSFVVVRFRRAMEVRSSWWLTEMTARMEEDGGGGSCAVVCGTSMVAIRGAAMAFWFARSEEAVSGMNEEDDGKKMEVL